MFIVIAFFLLQHARAGGCKHRAQIDTPDIDRVAARMENAAKGVAKEFKEAVESAGLDAKEIVELAGNDIVRCTDRVCLAGERLGTDGKEAATIIANSNDNIAKSIDNAVERGDRVITAATDRVCGALENCSGDITEALLAGCETVNRMPQNVKDQCLDYCNKIMNDLIIPLATSAGIANAMVLPCVGFEYLACNPIIGIALVGGTSIGGGAGVYIAWQKISSNSPQILNRLMDISSKEQKQKHEAIEDCQRVLEKDPEYFPNGILEMNNFVGSWELVKDGKKETYTVQLRNDIGVVRNQRGPVIWKITKRTDDEDKATDRKSVV